MCQLCRVTDTADRDRWPKPLVPTLTELRDIVERVHPDVEVYNNRQPHSTTETASADPADPAAREQHRQGLITTARMVLTVLELLESERGEWWAGKGAQRREWERAGAWQRLTALQSVNNRTQAMVREMEAKVGMFARWTLGVEGLEAGE